MTTKKLEDYSKEELIQHIKSLKKTKKFGLVWEDKPEQVAIECEQKLPVIEEVTDRALSAGDDSPTHLIIEGDNYHSLSTLNYTHAGAIDVIYIDPPYNTGKKDFVYNDHFVDKEDEFRHSKWLSFMNKRLLLAKHLLKEDGVVFISIDDNEYANLKILCDQIFGEDSFINNFMWLHGKGKKNKQSRTLQQYTLAYSRKGRDNLRAWSMTKSAQGNFTNPDNDPRGAWFSGSISFSEERSNKNSEKYFEITSPSGRKWQRQWMCTKDEMDAFLADSKIYFGKAPDYANTPRLKIFPDDTNDLIPDNILDNCSTTRAAQKELDGIIGLIKNQKGKLVSQFENPKPRQLIEHLIDITQSSKSAIILDFFAGSGTTGHVVIEMNEKDKGDRKFILCTNNENNIAENITYQRIKKVTEGYGKTAGIPANVRYFKTDFVDKKKTNDQTRMALLDRCTDLIRVREGAYTSLIDENSIKLFDSTDHVAMIVFDPDELPNAIAKIKELKIDKPVHLYVFSLSSYAYEDELQNTGLDITTCPIPESVMEVYQRIFRKRGENV